MSRSPNLVLQKEITANGLRFSYLQSGEGPMILFLHGYPDNAWSWEYQFAEFSHTGYTVVAPFLRGYPPTDIAAGL